MLYLILALQITIYALFFLKFRELKYELSFLPNGEEIMLAKHPLINTNILHLIDKKVLVGTRDITIIFASPSCNMCHEKLSLIINKKKYDKSDYIVYAENSNENEFNTFKKKFKEIEVLPLSIDMTNSLNKGMFPFFLLVDSKGTVKKAYVK